MIESSSRFARRLPWPRPRHSACAEIDLFAGLSDRALQRVDSLCTQVTVCRGRHLIHQGRPGREVFVIRGGTVAISANGILIDTLGAGSLLGEMAVLYNCLRAATARTLTDTDLLVFSPAEFASLLCEPRLAIRVQATADRRRLVNSQRKVGFDQSTETVDLSITAELRLRSGNGLGHSLARV